MHRIIMSQRSIFFLLFLFTASAAFGQKWFMGTVVLESENTIRGEISYRPETDVIFLKAGDASMVLTAFRVKYFTIADGQAGADRMFISRMDSVGVATAYRFYEVVVHGAINVLRQQHKFWYSLHREATDYNYFVVIQDRIMPMIEFRRYIFPNLKASSENLQEFAKKNKINRQSTNDVIAFIEYYNDVHSGFASVRR
jgi:hypothetical protein